MINQNTIDSQRLVLTYRRFKFEPTKIFLTSDFNNLRIKTYLLTLSHLGLIEIVSARTATSNSRIGYRLNTQNTQLNLQEVKKMNIDDKMIDALITLREGGIISEEEFMIKLKQQLHTQPTSNKLRLSDLSNKNITFKHWSDEEEAKLIQMRQDGMSVKNIAQALGRSYISTERKLYKYRKSGVVARKITANSWTQQELDILDSMRREGKKPREIALVLNKTPTHVSAKLHALKVLQQQTQNGNL